MATEPEPQSTGVGNNLSMSTEAQLNAFRARLDGEKISTIKVIPGFLFRNGKEREVRSFHGRGVMVYSLDWADDCLVPKDDEFLLEKHTETYRKGLEARDQLLDRINVVEILGMVRDIWGRGEIRHEGSKAVLWCNYTFTKEEIKGIEIVTGGVIANVVNSTPFRAMLVAMIIGLLIAGFFRWMKERPPKKINIADYRDDGDTPFSME